MFLVEFVYLQSIKVIDKQEIKMKVKLKAILKTNDSLFQPFEQNQIIFHAGNVNKTWCQFIQLTKQLTYLYAFKPTPNKKGCFVAQKLQHNKINISHYSLKKERKTVCLSDSSQFFPGTQVEQVHLLVDQFDSMLVYGYASAGTDHCIFLVDFNKLKIVAIGYVTNFNDIKVNLNQNLMLSLCYGNTVRVVHVYNGFWETNQKIYKKLGNVNVIRHEILSGQLTLLCTKSHLYFIQQMQVIQTIVVYQQNQNQIVDIIKLSKALLVISKTQKMKIYIQDHDQLTYIYKGILKIKLKPNQKIQHIALSANGQQLFLRTNKNQLWNWKVEEILLPSEVAYQFTKIYHPMITEPKGTVTLASGKQTALLASDHNLTLWDLDRNMPFLQESFTKFDKNQDRAIYASSINPDGNSIICAFQDKIKIYKILLTKLRFIAEFSIKKCSQIVYSHGGQFVACKFGKGINSSISIINTLRFTQITVFKVHAEPSFILWNQMDDQLIVATQNDQVSNFKISDSLKSSTIKFQQKINMVRLDYLSKKLMVSSDKQIFIIPNNSTEIQKIIKPKITKFNFIFPLHGIYFVATKDGNLYWSSNINFQTYNQLPIFTNQPYSLIYRNGYLLAYSSFQNISVIECERQNMPVKKQLLKTSEDIVFVQRDEINIFFQKIKNLQSLLQQLQTSTSVKLEEQKRRHDQLLSQSIRKFNDQIQYLHKRYLSVNQEKLKQQKQNGCLFEQLQSGQVQSVNDLQKMYDRKIRLQRQKYMDLEQRNIQQKVHYQKVIYELQKRYHDDIAKIRQQYSTKLVEEFKRIEETKHSELQYKKKMEFKLMSLQQQAEMAVFDMQHTKDDKISELHRRILELESIHDSSKVSFHSQLTYYKQMQDDFKIVQNDLKKHKQQLNQALQRIKLLETQIKSKSKMIEQRNILVSQQDHQISGLQKAKYVLSFRTTEVRKQIQPKQQLIDKLKSQMFKLHEQFSDQKKKVHQLSQKTQKLQKLNKILKDDNIQLKLKFENRQRAHDEMSAQIFTIVNQMDQKQWPPALIKVYQGHIKQDKFKNKKKQSKDATAEQINRHLVHLQQSLLQVTSGNEKILKGRQIDVRRKMKQNAQLVTDLNIMRKQQKQYQNKITLRDNQIARLKREIHQSNRSTTRANTAKSITRRGMSRQKDLDQTGLDFSGRKDNFQMLFEKRDLKTRQSRSRVSSGHKTMIMRNDKKDSLRFFDLAKELQNAKYMMGKQQKMIQQLNHRLLEQDL